MPYAGKTLMPRQFVSLVAPHWPNSKVKALATALGESNLSVGAWHDNLDDKGVETSRDCGIYQINVDDKYIGTTVESNLRTDSLDEAVYNEVVTNNIDAAYRLYNSPWKRDGKDDVRRWQPWVAYNSGWAMFPESWVWHQDPDHNPIGPWYPTGRYLHRAIRAVANWHLLIIKDMNAEQALAEAKRLAKVYGVESAENGQAKLLYDTKKFVYWVFPPMPTKPPSDGIGTRPIPNDGR